jgi:site-specific DNA recombinase
VTETAARCAVYARYSNEKQNPLTVDQQIRKCREFASRHALRILDPHIHADEAISGATDDRPGLRALLAAARETPRPFDVILVDDTSRLSRKQSGASVIVEKLQFLGVRVVFVAQGIDSDSEQAGLLIGVHGIVDSMYLKDLSKRTFRGVEQLALKGLHTGGRVFGYRRVPILSNTQVDSHGRPLIAGVKLEVDPGQAGIVNRIFERYASGASMKRIAIDLNDSGILSPQPQKGRISRSWCPSSIRHILRNDRYRGLVIWGKTQKVRSPETEKRIYRRRPQSEWRRREIPEQRIVSEELWAAVRNRMRIVEKLYDCGPGKRPRMGRSAGSQYLFTDFSSAPAVAEASRLFPAAGNRGLIRATAAQCTRTEAIGYAQTICSSHAVLSKRSSWQASKRQFCIPTSWSTHSRALKRSSRGL